MYKLMSVTKICQYVNLEETTLEYEVKQDLVRKIMLELKISVKDGNI